MHWNAAGGILCGQEAAKVEAEREVLRRVVDGPSNRPSRTHSIASICSIALMQTALKMRNQLQTLLRIQAALGPMIGTWNMRNQLQTLPLIQVAWGPTTVAQSSLRLVGALMEAAAAQPNRVGALPSEAASQVWRGGSR
uniref:Uncharacterized protein n=1 Tax=Haptolina ericina TaxID=156174 RepID=A0A7S3EZW2_9EUKA|mmetsp:Transcript_36841/g.83382  ORF Transcript_36841/g.83382 Transcript_36841/m.83382 type:complete len:139 (+) Transcript_36841:151-567(+)